MEVWTVIPGSGNAGPIAWARSTGAHRERVEHSSKANLGDDPTMLFRTHPLNQVIAGLDDEILGFENAVQQEDDRETHLNPSGAKATHNVTRTMKVIDARARSCGCPMPLGFHRARIW